MALPPNAAALKPYLAPLLLSRSQGAPVATFLVDLLIEVEGAIVSKGAVMRSVPVRSALDIVGALSVATIEYTETSVPTWAPKGPLRDLNHHLVVVAVTGDLAAVCTSESSLRNKLGRDLSVARPLQRARVEQAFVGARANVIWLNGIHTPTDSRPNAKTLMGSALEYALDPLGDQSFYYSAVSSRIAWPGGSSETLVGAAPGAGRIWVNRPPNWGEFLQGLTTIFHLLAAPPAANVKFPALAQATADLTEVKGAYALTLVPPELLSDQDLTAREREAANRWAYDTEFEVWAGVGADAVAKVTLQGTDLGDVTVSVALVDDKVVTATDWTRTPAGLGNLRTECGTYLEDADWIKIYYDSAHAVSQGRCYVAAYRDQQFEWRFESFANYDVKVEKPTPHGTLTLATAIGAPKANGSTDDSLFAYVLQVIGHQGWLASDDGSMEMGDFIHITDDHVVTLIHAKGSKSRQTNRAVSVSNYEVVVGQAVKNLRHLERKTLADELKRGKDKQIGKAVWYNGVRQTAGRGGMIARANLLPHNYKRRVIVLQPQLTETEHQACLAPGAPRARAVRMKQLDTLMLSARLSCMAVGAEFIGWAAK